MTCKDIRAVPEWLPRLAFHVHYYDQGVYQVMDGDMVAFTANLAPFSEAWLSDTASPVRKLCTAGGSWHVLWTEAPDISKPVMISQIPEVYWRYII